MNGSSTLNMAMVRANVPAANDTTPAASKPTAKWRTSGSPGTTALTMQAVVYAATPRATHPATTTAMLA